jgi:hypothetical protein
MTMMVAAALLALALAAPAVFAASPAAEQCAALGGTYTKTGPGQFTCVYATNPGNPQSDNAAKPFKTNNTQTGQGGGGEKRSSSTNPGGHTF